jgi:hypothetical protein
MTPAETAYDLASYAASPLHLPIAYRGQRTIACRHYTDRPATEDEIAALCEAAGAPRPVVLVIPPVRRLVQMEMAL